ncbi:bifunctional hydroxymethylpyrimidine kinase/phosphomethylpyrimidine kinase [Clostridium botulinum]|uniref:bifunctional hydroxymethylpyrimidine kinase/phosphomethylpyrimidine kinase n=1 Tax=Clostridium botulinum TaxID=1491 RepID=UPI001A9279D4|nr:bifunctional hydroxymethylpyrimidine kinase/phosphomethylpyrimidine kinase [Clostridium botulinum]MBO0526199.1 bifunctional hydroxymethylpyrimidine kinase/phosphomethylpyrimidine kinase [Clostridium botulinum]MBO0527938.1 bifunctional hydroxymethylpyrimidine kinase/phosphomethylpyrimidine kinase [Clostridium botulinum]MBO0531120.1 bifunctional hydroxymethylpyrimidine kinase/phosphomethylpyrimidine kinase [Clostridium botulinum]MBO0534733.1 bifunctional hydroxymethylpyrimidine kinase/phosphom
MKKVLTIAGSDSCGGAGIQADIKTMSSLGVYAMSIITAVTAQNSIGVQDVHEVPNNMVEAQIKSIFDDIDVDAVKIGMLSNSETIKSIKEYLEKYKAKNIVLDPVMVSKSGYFLLKPEAIEELKNLISISHIVTPNIPEAEVLSGMKISSEDDMKKAATIIQSMGSENVLLKGGHRCNDANDILLYKDKFITIPGNRIETKNTHGTGCTLSSAIASYLAKGFGIEKSVSLSKEYITKAIENSFPIGEGVGPVGHFINLYKKAHLDY